MTTHCQASDKGNSDSEPRGNTRGHPAAAVSCGPEVAEPTSVSRPCQLKTAPLFLHCELRVLLTDQATTPSD